MPGHLKKKKSKDTLLKFLASPMFYLQYMISCYLIFSMDITISFKQKNVFVFVPALRAVPILQESPPVYLSTHGNKMMYFTPEAVNLNQEI